MSQDRDIVAVLREAVTVYRDVDGPAHAYRYEKAADEIERLRRIERAARDLVGNSPIGDDDKPYASDIMQSEFSALVETL